jgi:hypothetical protein
VIYDPLQPGGVDDYPVKAGSVMFTSSTHFAVTRGPSTGGTRGTTTTPPAWAARTFSPAAGESVRVRTRVASLAGRRSEKQWW